MLVGPIVSLWSYDPQSADIKSGSAEQSSHGCYGNAG